MEVYWIEESVHVTVQMATVEKPVEVSTLHEVLSVIHMHDLKWCNVIEAHYYVTIDESTKLLDLTAEEGLCG